VSAIGSWWSELDSAAKAIISVIGVIAAGIAAYAAYDKLMTQKSDCLVSGVAYRQASNEPLSGVRVGYAVANAGEYSSNQARNIPLITLAQSGSDGRFAGECNGAHDAVASSSFEVVYVGGSNTRLPGLPCLETRYSGQRVRNRGEHSGLVLEVPDC
jgi:hypothetical protein